MTNEEAKRWAELFTAIAKGKQLQKRFDGTNTWLDTTPRVIELDDVSNYRIKPQPKTRRRTYQELSNWLRECPQEHREFKRADSKYVYVVLGYDEDDANEEVSSDILIRRNNGEWEEPLIEVEE